MGWRGKKHTCLQINWFGQEASKEELCVVKQACGEAGMSQQKKHHCDHGEDHDAVLTHKHTRAHNAIYAHRQHLLQLLRMDASVRILTGVCAKWTV